MGAAIWGFIGTLVGALASIGTTWLSARHASSLQASASKLARAETGRAFQRDTLLELQDALHDLMRLIVRGNIEDQTAFRQSGTWGKQPLTAEVNEGQRLANRRFAILVERVANDALRTDLKDIQGLLSQISLARTANESQSALHNLSVRATQVLEHLGTVLRAQY